MMTERSRKMSEKDKTITFSLVHEKEKETIISIRNAFSHNTYRINLHEAMPQEKIKLPNVAYLIFKLMDNYHKKITGKYSPFNDMIQLSRIHNKTT